MLRIGRQRELHDDRPDLRGNWQRADSSAADPEFLSQADLYGLVNRASPEKRTAKLTARWALRTGRPLTTERAEDARFSRLDHAGVTHYL